MTKNELWVFHKLKKTGKLYIILNYLKSTANDVLWERTDAVHCKWMDFPDPSNSMCPGLSKDFLS